MSDIRERVGQPDAEKSVNVKLHDAVYNFGVAKYGSAHIGALCVVNGWLDDVTVTYDKNDNRVFKLKPIHPGDKIKMPRAEDLKKLDHDAFLYWDRKYPIKKKANKPGSGGPAGPGAPEKDPEKEKAEKHANDMKAAQKTAQALQTDLNQRKSELDKSIGNIFGHGADAWENAIGGHGSKQVNKALNEKQDQVKAMGKYANEGKLDEFGKIHKQLTGSDFDPSKQSAKVILDQEFKDFNKSHIAGVENLTEIASFGANWAAMSMLGKAKGITGWVKQIGGMALWGGFNKAAFKAVEHGNWNTAQGDAATGAISGVAFLAGHKITGKMGSKIHGQNLDRKVLRGVVSGGSGGVIFGAIETPNVSSAHARNEGRSYDAGNLAHDVIFGVGAGGLSGAALGGAFGAIGHGLGKLFAGKTPPPVEAPTAQVEAPAPQVEAPTAKPETPVAQAEALPPQAEAPALQAEAPTPQAEALPPQAETPSLKAEAPPPAEAPHRLSKAAVDRGNLAARALCESSNTEWSNNLERLMLKDMIRVCHPDAHIGAPQRSALANSISKKLIDLRSMMQTNANVSDIAKAKAELFKAWLDLEKLL